MEKKVTLTQSEMQYAATLFNKQYEAEVDKNTPSEAKKDLLEKTKTFWEYIEKKYAMDINKVDKIEPDGTVVFK